ncbi:metallophosphoesterase family protein [Thalassospira xiamenensis]|uniref:metallophosphoesterase family protein n=1 Tax=Thalassospira xiamenensis TaxID=220697 RepID=UPI001FFEA075|nr:metallophosphoesterase [Thalassospira xiamenensis]MCK2165756.1 metallophosphoesterase [Thalassospira xiamenensis]
MAAPLITLRFRDTTPKIDTIKEHIRVIEEKGSVLWGWWKKKSEPKYESITSKIEGKNDFSINIIDTSTNRMFIAKCKRTFSQNSASLDKSIIPGYYRIIIENIFFWFELTEIKETDYSENISKLIHENTILDTSNDKNFHYTEEKQRNTIKSTEKKDKSTIIFMSDLHFGKDYGFPVQDDESPLNKTKKTLSECIKHDLSSLDLDNDVAAVIVMGDFVTAGDWNAKTQTHIIKEFEQLSKILGIQKSDIISLPGNHDIVRYKEEDLQANISLEEILIKIQSSSDHEESYKLFSSTLSGHSISHPLNFKKTIPLKEVNIEIAILNSCGISSTIMTEYGFVGKPGLNILDEIRDMPIYRPSYKFLALHHHLLPVNQLETPQPGKQGKGVSMVLDAGHILQKAQESGIQIALHGHQHQPHVAQYHSLSTNGDNPVLVVANGSTGVKQERRPENERNTYCIFNLKERGAKLWIRELRTDGRSSNSVFEKNLNILPAT